MPGARSTLRVVIVGGGLVAIALASVEPVAPPNTDSSRARTVEAPADTCPGLAGTRRWAARESLTTAPLPADVTRLADTCSSSNASSCEPLLAGLQGACDDGRERACGWLGAELRRGCLVAGDQDRADALYARQFDLVERACDDGDGVACFRLVEMYRLGIGTLPDREAANRVAACFCGGGETKACKDARREAHPEQDSFLARALSEESVLTDRVWRRTPHVADNPLEDAFRSGSPLKLRAFLEEWHGSVPPASDDDLRGEPQVVRETYALFPLIYERLSRLPGYLGILEGVRYALVQDVIFAQVEGEAPRLIVRFRPRLDPAARYLYPDERHAAWLNAFLACDSQWPTFLRDRSRLRLGFLSPPLPIGNFECDRCLYGEVELIRFDAAVTSARFSLRIGDTGGGGAAEKRSDGWHIRYADVFN